jgi:hypothetical protein
VKIFGNVTLGRMLGDVLLDRVVIVVTVSMLVDQNLPDKMTQL